MVKFQKSAFIGAAILVVVALGGGNLLIAEYLLHLYQMLPKKKAISHHSEPASHQGEKSTGSKPSAEQDPSAESDEDGSAQDPDLDLFTMVAQRTDEILTAGSNPGTPLFIAQGSAAFSGRSQNPIGPV
jgi:hypothetical protein